MSSPPDPQAIGDEGEFRLVPERLGVLVGRTEVALSPNQFRLLALMMSEPGRTFGRAELFQSVIGQTVELRTIDVYIKDIRRRLEPQGGRIETVRGRGYRYRGG